MWWGNVEGWDFDVVEPEAVRVANGGSYGGAANRKAESWWGISGFDGVEPEVSGGSQAPMNGLGKEKGPMREGICTDILSSLHPYL